MTDSVSVLALSVSTFEQQPGAKACAAAVVDCATAVECEHNDGQDQLGSFGFLGSKAHTSIPDTVRPTGSLGCLLAGQDSQCHFRKTV